MAHLPTHAVLQLPLRARWGALFWLLAASLVTRAAHAQSAEVWQPASLTASERVLLIREDEAPRDAFVLRVERALNRALSDLGLAVNQSSLPFHDAQLAAGCGGSVRDCGGHVALALESEQLLVATIEENPGGRYPSLTLQRFEPHTTVRTGTAQLPREMTAELDLTVYALVESVFEDRAERRARASALPALTAQIAAQPPVQAAATPALSRTSHARRSEDADAQPGARKHTALLLVGWSSLALGAGLLVGGVVSGVSARHEDQAYAAISPDSREEVDDKLAHHRSAQDKAETARLLWGFGGGFAAAGIFTLLWERFGPLSDRKLQKSQVSSSASVRQVSPVRIFAAPSPHGLSLWWRARL